MNWLSYRKYVNQLTASYKSLKLNFTNILDFQPNFVGGESFLESNSCCMWEKVGRRNLSGVLFIFSSERFSYGYAWWSSIHEKYNSFSSWFMFLIGFIQCLIFISYLVFCRYGSSFSVNFLCSFIKHKPSTRNFCLCKDFGNCK